MKYRLKEVDGYVSFLLNCGKDKVSSKMPTASVQRMLDNGKVDVLEEETEYPICVDNDWFFAGEIVKRVSQKEAE